MIGNIMIGKSVVLRREAAGCHITAGVERVVRVLTNPFMPPVFSTVPESGSGVRLDNRDVVSLTEGGDQDAWERAIEQLSGEISDAQRRYIAVAESCPPDVMQAIREKLGIKAAADPTEPPDGIPTGEPEAPQGGQA